MLRAKSKTFRFYLAPDEWARLRAYRTRATTQGRVWYYGERRGFWGKLAGGELPRGKRLAIDLTMTPCSASRATARIRRAVVGGMDVKVPGYAREYWCGEAARRLFSRSDLGPEWIDVRVDIEYEVLP